MMHKATHIGEKEPKGYRKVKVGKSIKIYHDGKWIGTAKGVTQKATEQIANDHIENHKEANDGT